MIYLDYSATTPVDEEILDIYCQTTREYIGNPNSSHDLGQKSKNRLYSAMSTISNIFNCYQKEIIFTSGASESNATAIRGVADSLASKGRHIITSKLEHKSILDEMSRLHTKGYEITYVNILPNGLLDLKDLENKIREDTILVSICYVNSETGYKQDLKAIRQVINNKNPEVIFHSDMTQALGKTEIDLSSVDLASMSSHKIYAPKGVGLLYKNRKISIDRLISGTTSNSPFRGGTPALPLIVAFSEAIKKYTYSLKENEEKCRKLKEILVERLKKLPIRINSNENSISQIVNVSLLDIDSKEFIDVLSKNGIYVSTTTACSAINTSSVILDAITNNDKRISGTTVRISISHLTTETEIYKFVSAFEILYNSMKPR